MWYQILYVKKIEKVRFPYKNYKIFLQKESAISLEIIGVDGNYCIGSTALDGVKKGFSICCNEKCIGVGKSEKFKKTKAKLINDGVKFI